MAKLKTEYVIGLPAWLNCPDYDSLEHNGRTMAYGKSQAVSQFLQRQNPDGFKIILKRLKEDYGSLQIFAEEVGVSLKRLGLEDLDVFQTEEDLEDGKKLTKEEKELLREYELARILASRDGVDSFVNRRTLFHYLNNARSLT